MSKNRQEALRGGTSAARANGAASRRTTIQSIVLHALGEHKARTVLAALVIIGSIVLEVLPPLVLASAVDALTGSQAVTLALALGYFALVACSGLADALREGMIVAIGESITHALRTAMMDKLRRLPAAYFTDHEAGTTASLHVDDVDAIEDMFSSGIVSMVCDLGTVVGILVVVFAKSLGLGILLVIALPLLFAFTRHVQRRMLAAHTENRRASAEASGILPETLHCIRSLHVYQAEGFAEQRYDQAIQRSFRAMEKTNFYDAVYSPVILTASAVVIAVMMSLSGQSGAFRALFGMSVGTAVALISYVNSIFTPLSSIGMEIQTVQSAAAGWKRVQAYLDEEERPACASRAPHDLRKGRLADLDGQDGAGLSGAAAPAADACRDAPDAAETAGPVAVAASGHQAEPAASAPGADAGAGEPAISVEDACFSYDGKHEVLDGFSLDVMPGEFVTLMGRTGAGKSTLFKLLLGLYEPDRGSIRIAGIRPQELGEDDRRRTICCVEQQLVAVPGTVRDQVTLGDDAFGDGAVWQALATAGLRDAVAALPGGLDAPYSDALFSQGQKQLLMIARAIVSDPQILLLDEITAGLDSATEQQVSEALRKASDGRAVLSISHRLSEVIAGRIVTMA